MKAPVRLEDIPLARFLEAKVLVLDTQQRVVCQNPVALCADGKGTDIREIDQLTGLAAGQEESGMFHYYFRQTLREETITFEWNLMCPRTGKRYYKVRMVRTEIRKQARVVIIMEDITAYRSVEASLKSKTRELENIFESMIDTYFFIDLQGKIQKISPSILLMCGYESYEMEHRNIRMLFAEEKEYRDLLEKGRLYGVLEDFEATFLKTGDESFFVSININLVFDESEEPVGYEGFIRDITDRKNIENQLRQSREELKMVNRQLEIISRVDPLTSLSNRRDIQEKMECEEKRFQRNHQVFSILMMDIDKFKSINDERGHDFGDRVLVEVSRLLRGSLRRQDQLGRWGGEEFIVLLPETPLEGAVVMAERLRSSVCQNPVRHAKISIPVTITIGAAEYNDSLDSLEECINQSDKALYHGKEHGRNRVVSWAEIQS